MQSCIPVLDLYRAKHVLGSEGLVQEHPPMILWSQWCTRWSAWCPNKHRFLAVFCSHSTKHHSSIRLSTIIWLNFSVYLLMLLSAFTPKSPGLFNQTYSFISHIFVQSTGEKAHKTKTISKHDLKDVAGHAMVQMNLLSHKVLRIA